jgi:pimeloyl-ACP methyl ester carboxylesterase
VSEFEITVVVVLVVASTAIFVYVLSLEVERQNPPIGRWLDVDGVRLHYVEKGHGQPLVLLHGNGTMIQDFLVSGFFDAAARSFRVIAFDRPGYGYSERPRLRLWTPMAQARLLRRAFNELGIERPIVLGHSWATLVALALAIHDPRAVRALVLLSGFYYPRFRFDAIVFSPPAIPIIGDVLRYTLSPVLGLLLLPIMLRQMFAPRAVTQAFANRFPRALMLRPWQIRASAEEALLMIPAAARLRRHYAKLAMPVLIMCGLHDRIVTFERQSQRLQKDIQGSELHGVPDVGHMIHHSVPEEVLTAINRLRDREAIAQRGTGAEPASVPAALSR